MKNIVIAVLLIAAIALGTIAYRQANQAAQNRAELLQAHTELAAAQTKLTASAEAADKAASVERSSKAIQETLVKTSQFAKEKEQQAAQLQEKLADAKTNSSNPMAGVAKMFNDPKMREMIKSQQKLVMGPMIEKQYGALFEQLKLTPDEGGQLKKLLTDKMLAGADAGEARKRPTTGRHMSMCCRRCCWSSRSCCRSSCWRSSSSAKSRAARMACCAALTGRSPS